MSESTPSILERSWLTIESLTPVPPPVEPRCLQMASNSSKMMMCSSESSPRSACSFSASANSARMFSSLWPTYLLRISGPLTIFGGRACSALPICRAMSVLPQPGGPKSSMPRACFWPIFFMMSGGTTRDANARRKMSWNSLFRPPMPSASKLKPLAKSFELPLAPDDDPVSFRPAADDALRSDSSVVRKNWPNLTPPTSKPPSVVAAAPPLRAGGVGRGGGGRSGAGAGRGRGRRPRAVSCTCRLPRRPSTRSRARSSSAACRA